MSTFQVRVEDKVGTVSDTVAISDWLTDGARHITNLIPPDKLEKYTVALPDAGSGISVALYRVLKAHKLDYGARRIDAGMKARAEDSNSIHYATTDDPCWTIINGKAYVIPSGGTVQAMAYPTVVYSESTITSFPSDLEDGVVTYAAMRARLRQLSDLYESIDSLSFNSGVLPIAPSAPSFTFTAVSYVDANYDAATYVDALIDTISSTSISFTDSLSYTPPVFQGNYTNTDTALAAEDIELGNAHLSKVNVRLNEYQNDLAQSMNTFAKDKAVFDTAFQQATIDAQLAQQRLIEQTRVQIELNKFNAQQTLQEDLANASQAMQLDITNRAKATEVAIINSSKELERQIQEFQAELSIYGQSMNGYATGIQAESARIGAELQKVNSQSQILLTGLQELRLEFQEFLQIIGIQNGK